MDIAGRNALVTGGAHRVGKAITLALARAGADVFIHYGRSATEAEATAEEVRALGRSAALGSANLTDPTVAGDLIDAATVALGPISILINSASGFPTDTLQDADLNSWRSTQDLSLTTPVFLTQAFADALPQGLGGAVVNVTDVKTATPYRTHFSYIVAKGGLDEFTKAAAVALAPEIRVNAVALGVILPPPGEDDAYAQRLADQIPMRRPGGTDPVAAAAVALVQNDFVTGETIRVDGGQHLV
ncbi:MAG: SDR family oxidoreductase [Acidimicrobiia bacterium]|nr:SDR family oxidoreductase [Acidimicrobiia bacterium]